MKEYSYLEYEILFVILLVAELIYFKVARRFGIIDKPNARSSHGQPTIRGGGIIFFIAILLWFFNSGWTYQWFFLGLSLVAIISFVDDVNPQRALVRFLIHLTAIALLFYQIQIYNWAWWLILIAAIICIGSLNAFNFMDGINGITGIYALVNLGTFLYIQKNIVEFSNLSLIIISIIAVLIFLYFNFRKVAVCFAGDVGSIVLAYIQIFLLLLLIVKSNNFYWVIMFLVFGIDTVLTIIHRIKLRENIFKPHRSHLYQYLANERGISHKVVSLLYGLAQLIINFLLIVFLEKISLWVSLIFILMIVFFYLSMRETLLRKLGLKGLFTQNI
jgi:UDP-N-acetylmuramyl pentapeptide phosphotransferase/UDP-N-acetylglucosamine-1-phosphate transferase